MDSFTPHEQKTSESEQQILASPIRPYVYPIIKQYFYSRNQSDKIQEYANKHNIKIIKTYADDGKSGIEFKWPIWTTAVNP